MDRLNWPFVIVVGLFVLLLSEVRGILVEVRRLRRDLKSERKQHESKPA